MEALEAQSKSTENTEKLRKRGKRGGTGWWSEGRGRKELMESWKKISRAWAIGSTESMRKVGRGRERQSTSKTHNSSFGQSHRYSRRRLSKTQRAKLGAIRRRKQG